MKVIIIAVLAIASSVSFADESLIDENYRSSFHDYYERASAQIEQSMRDTEDYRRYANDRIERARQNDEMLNATRQENRRRDYYDDDRY